MILSTDELMRANDSGVLESLLLGHGIIPLHALQKVLDEGSLEVSGLLEEIAILEQILIDNNIER